MFPDKHNKNKLPSVGVYIGNINNNSPGEKSSVDSQRKLKLQLKQTSAFDRISKPFLSVGLPEGIGIKL